MWKDIKGWEGLYEVSTEGEVRNKLTNHIIVGDYNSTGYKRVCLYNKNHNSSKQRFFIHRLVAETFIPNPDNLPEVNHIKIVIPPNNSIENLEWSNRKDNERHSHIIGTKPYKPFIVEYKNGGRKQYDFKTDLANELNISKVSVRHWLKNKNKGYLKYGISNIYYI